MKKMDKGFAFKQNNPIFVLSLKKKKNPWVRYSNSHRSVQHTMFLKSAISYIKTGEGGGGIRHFAMSKQHKLQVITIHVSFA